MAVVEVLDVVDVEHEHGHGLVGSAAYEGVLEGQVERPAVGKARASISAGLTLERRQKLPVPDGQGRMLGDAGDARSQLEWQSVRPFPVQVDRTDRLPAVERHAGKRSVSHRVDRTRHAQRRLSVVGSTVVVMLG